MTNATSASAQQPDVAALLPRLSARRAQRDASLPEDVHGGLISPKVVQEKLGIAPLPTEQEPIPRERRADKPWLPKPVAGYPTDNVLAVADKALSKEDKEITDLPVELLLPLLSSGQLSAVRCLQAFQRRAALAHGLCNPVTEFLTAFAQQQAQKCDDYLKQHGKPIGPLHGLPVSLKDQFCVAGYDTVMGYASYIGVIKERHAAVTELLVRAGAVPFVHTNVPNSLMRGETDNHVFGRTVNPHNRSFTPGGSSGGEGCLVALHGSPLGLATDIGGSIRIPAAFNGLWGFRPSMHRVPYEGAENSFKGQESISSVIGPVTHSLAGCVAFFRAILAGRPWELDPIATAMPFNERAYKLQDLGLRAAASSGADAAAVAYEKGRTQLCFAVLENDGVVTPHPPIARAMKEARAKLEKAGHKVIEFGAQDLIKAAGAIVVDIWSADGGVDIATECAKGGEPLMYNAMQGEKPSKHLSTYESWQANQRRDAWRKAFLDHWQGTASQTGTGRPIDGLLAPVAPWASAPHDLNDYVGYTALFNLADRPAITFPVGFVDQAVDAKQPTPAGASEFDRELYERYDPARWHGMPINLQLAGSRGQDEELLGFANVLIDAGVPLHA